MLNSTFITPYKIILGSGSPRRSEILRKAKIPFTERVISIEEDFPDSYPPKKVPEYLALKKAKAHEDILKPEEIVITADSIVIIDDEILGKPENDDDAKRILTKLSGRSHLVVTGVCLFSMHKKSSFSSESIVQFADLSSEEIEYYIKNYHPIDKAGAYGIQDWIGYNKVIRIEGSYLNIMGLPMEQLYHKLQDFITHLKVNKPPAN